MNEFDDLIPKGGVATADPFADLIPKASSSNRIPARISDGQIVVDSGSVPPEPRGPAPMMVDNPNRSALLGGSGPGTVTAALFRPPFMPNPDFKPYQTEGFVGGVGRGLAGVLSGATTPGYALIPGVSEVPVVGPAVTAGVGLGFGGKMLYDTGKELSTGVTAPKLGEAAVNIPMSLLMLAGGVHEAGRAVAPVTEAYRTADRLTPTTQPNTPGPANPRNDIVLDVDQPVAASTVGVEGDQGGTAQVRLGPGQPAVPGEFDDLVPKTLTTEAAAPVVAAEPLNPGGSQADLPPDLQAQSKANNSREAFEALAKAKGTTMLPASESKGGESDVQQEERQVQGGNETQGSTGVLETAKPLEPKGNLMSEEAAPLRHDLLAGLDQETQKRIGKYYTDTGDLKGALDQARDARDKNLSLSDELDALAKKVADPKADRLTAAENARIKQLAQDRPVLHKKFLDRVQELRKGGVPETDKTIGSGIRAALEKNEGRESGFVNLQPVRDLFDKLVSSVESRKPKREFLWQKDAADNATRNVSHEAGQGLRTMARGLFGGQYQSTPGGRRVRFTQASDMALEATTAAVEANGDRQKLQDFSRRATAAGDQHAKDVADFAYINWDRLQPLVDRVNQIHEVQYQREVAAGISYDKREAYIQHLIDPDKLQGGVDRFGARGQGASGFTKMRYNDTLFDHVENGNSKAIRSWNAADLVENRLRQGLQKVNDAAWIEGMRHSVDPTTGRPIVRGMQKQVNPTTGTEHLVAPEGYEAWSPFPGRTFAVHKGYANFLDSVTAMGWLGRQEAFGLPVGRAMLEAAGGIKHSMLLFDTFHAMRMTLKGLSLGVMDAGRLARGLIEYNDQDLKQAVSNGEITQAMADYARNNRADYKGLVRNGMNVGSIAENLDNNLWKKLPIAGDYNKWVFEKLTRSVMTEAALKEVQRQAAQNPTITREQIYRKVAKDMNFYFGNIGRQGLFHSKTMGELSRMAFLAPQWFESMAQTEARAAGQTVKALGTGKVGSIARGSGTLLAASVIATQLGNLITKGQPTWKNNKGHKLDMWVPGVAKGDKGYWFSPLSVPFEITHDVVRYMNAGQDKTETAMQIIGNKMSPGARAVEQFREGRDFSGAKLRGEARWENAAKQLVPLPLPLQGALNPNTSVQRQAMASAGLKMEPVKATKAERAAGDRSLESMSLAERRQLQGQIKEPRSLTERGLALERSAEAEAKRNQDLYDSLPRQQRQWVDAHKLELPTYEDTLQMGTTRLSLTEKERDFVTQKVQAEYSRVIGGLMQNPTFDQMTQKQQQNRVNTLMTQARGRVRVALRKEMASQRQLLTQ